MRPFPTDPQWLQLDRKLPPDRVVQALIKFGFRMSDIADRFDVPRPCVSAAARRLGLDPIPCGSTWRTNGARLPKFRRAA